MYENLENISWRRIIEITPYDKDETTFKGSLTEIDGRKLIEVYGKDIPSVLEKLDKAIEEMEDNLWL